ncbi:uncharacterized protein LY79DRAFT_192909 [Colletotrichum navitas]|uniref:Uncharacterized protein n=1 Tax=Colletotrichum navitas TaxID=681940 RepID=A0AAD8PZL2_9PEZI|nr:uncharacterized protein LY79DRAFT_192909 [Colletotrichum navitas]KAK1590846.1 hypothetical protein LY79DRAFT_192909 [Colletotrichum navitas]
MIISIVCTKPLIYIIVKVSLIHRNGIQRITEQVGVSGNNRLIIVHSPIVHAASYPRQAAGLSDSEDCSKITKGVCCRNRKEKSRFPPCRSLVVISFPLLSQLRSARRVDRQYVPRTSSAFSSTIVFRNGNTEVYGVEIKLSPKSEKKRKDKSHLKRRENRR